MLDKDEKELLRRIVGRAVFRKAVEEICIQMFTDNKETSNTMEGAAFAYKTAEGACIGFSKLFALAGMPGHEFAILPKRLKQER